MSKNGGGKVFLRDSLVGWLGEFVALNKTPDCRLSSASHQFLNEAILEERQKAAEGPRHLRSVSSQTAVLRLRQRLRCHKNGNDATNGDSACPPVCHHARHVSMPCGGGGEAQMMTAASSPRVGRLFPHRFRRGDRRSGENGEGQKSERPKTAISEIDETIEGTANTAH
ncbi:hypothetical protein niasHT_030757 [Heterodera trifolii]|uniref:Uncharacterized protein n=1 Tax=Heterodera trifolii TaxID=157864 RepID=A0ABD2HQ52_9BILA